jgi:hypothetical protein
MDRFGSHENFRNGLVEDLRRQLLGPISEDSDEDKEEVLSISPLQLYATGVLFPQRLPQGLLEDSTDPETAEGSYSGDGDLSSVTLDEAKSNRGSYVDEGLSSIEREPLNLANEFSPSACGISFRLQQPTSLVVDLSYGTYAPETRSEPHPRAGQTGMDGKPFPATRDILEYRRTHHATLVPLEILDKTGALKPVDINGVESGLKLHVTVRRRSDDSLVVSIMAVNHKNAGAKVSPANEDAFFQVSLVVRQREGKPVFIPIDRDVGGSTDDAELASMELLYRHRRAFALGHGVAGDWNRDEALSEIGATDMVRSAAIPMYDLKPIKPRERPFDEADLRLSMSFLYDADGNSDPEKQIVQTLETLARDYAKWIAHIDEGVKTLDLRLKQAAINNLDNCRKCHARMLRGIETLRSNAIAMLAFRLMNKAMLVQQVRSQQLRLRELDTPYPEFLGGYRDPPGGERKWRPFQLAFILMNITGMVLGRDPERDLVDLIWFPTGGGKTEAYLGLAAFTICIERLTGPLPGTIVIMRYTLRLLTAQQFQRAATLALALEAMRQDHDLKANLGSAEISIGLWVGQSLSPNKRSDAKLALDRLKQDQYAPNPFQVLQCPWCGVTFTNRKRLGYQDVRVAVSTERSVRFICPDDNCRFGGKSAGLPVQVVDEEIYAAPPSIVIGTVDKFAQIAWDDRVGRIFGVGTDAPPPALIIQDELHLISGPLGTIVGLYETAIDKLCSRDGRTAKIVASTATIRRAQQQCHDLYARKAFEFPPQAIRAGESYFAFEDQESPGRLYVGFMGTAVKSHQTALVRACSPLLQGVCYPTTEEERSKRAIIDPYGTLVWYFNSLRELGHAATLCVGDIPEFLKGLCHRLRVPYENRRYIREIVELTSRRNADEIPAILQQLEEEWRMKPGKRPPVDILLATNMIAVGVDVARLGLIVMSGQPKSTSEYIQATSRVGRRYPGLVVTVYTQTKSRDRSHYERFVAYHQSLYRYVEPTSVTPFSPQARERGMRGVMIAFARLLAGISTPDLIVAKEDEFREQIDSIRARIEMVDQEELNEALAEIEEWLQFWKNYAPHEYGKMGGVPSDSTLVYPFGGVPDQAYQRDAWPMLTSMRNVDGTCAARVLNVYEVDDDQQEAAQ